MMTNELINEIKLKGIIKIDNFKFKETLKVQNLIKFTQFPKTIRKATFRLIINQLF